MRFVIYEKYNSYLNVTYIFYGFLIINSMIKIPLLFGAVLPTQGIWDKDKLNFPRILNCTVFLYSK